MADALCETSPFLEYGQPCLLELPVLKIDREEALRYAGVSKGFFDDEVLCHRFENLASLCEKDIKPSCLCMRLKVDAESSQLDILSEDPQVSFEGTSFVLPGKDIVVHLLGAHEVVLVACTLGAQNEREIRKYTALGPTDALLYGALSSALVEAAARSAHLKLAAFATAQGMQAGSRYSPGYGDLSLAVQPSFLEVLGASRRIGLIATESCLLVPTKSTTAVVGLTTDSALKTVVGDLCATCPKSSECALKKRGRTCCGR